jgi:hypothetical protein
VLAVRRLSLEGEIKGEIPPGSGATKLQLAPTALAGASSYGIETVRGEP